MSDNKLMINKKFDIKQYSKEELRALQDMIFDKKIEELSEEFESIKKITLQNTKEIELVNDKCNARIDDLKEEINRKTEIAINSMRLKNKNGYCNLTGFGEAFVLKISRVRVGKLFKVIELAMPSRGYTTPFQHVCKNEYSRPKIYNSEKTYYIDREGYEWNYEKCLNKLESWLKKHNEFNKFYSISTTKEMENYVDNLYDQYIK